MLKLCTAPVPHYSKKYCGEKSNFKHIMIFLHKHEELGTRTFSLEHC